MNPLLRPFRWGLIRRAARALVFSNEAGASALREAMYEYADVRPRWRVPFLGGRWMGKGIRSSDEALILLGRRQMIDFVERLASLSQAQVETMDGRRSPVDVEAEIQGG